MEASIFLIIIGYTNPVLLTSYALIFNLNQNANNSAKLHPITNIVISGNNSHNKFELGFDTKNMIHRSAQEEWQLHRAQTPISQEWWYFTALLHDVSGNQYLLFNTLFKLDGKNLPFVNKVPNMGNDKTVILPVVELSNYNTAFHYYNSDIAIVNPQDIWNSKSNTLSYHIPHYSELWGFNGNNINAALKSQNLSFSLSMQGSTHVMWSKDKIYNKDGFIQEGLPGNVSFYYSFQDSLYLVIYHISIKQELTRP